MPATEIPPGKPLSPPAQLDGSDLYDAERWETAYREMHNVPALLIQLQDDLSQARRREAFWISVVVHLAIMILLVNSERLGSLFPKHAVEVVPSHDWMKDKELTYLEQPPDTQKPVKRPNTNIISDKDRIATSRTPQLDRKELKKILDSARPGPPGPTTPPVQQPPQEQASAQPPQQQQQQQPQQQAPKPQDDNQNALRLQQQLQQQKPSFNTGSLSAGSAVEQAARAAASSPGRFGGGGDYGLGQGRQASKAVGELDVLSDTMGVDFGPYLQRVLHDVRMNWYNLIPEAARPPLMKKGKVSIEFAILKDGRIAGMTLSSTSGDVSLDRAAWGGITGSSPFPPLPAEFRGDYLALRFHFYYNPDSNEMQ
jgi:TonB family protein